MGADILHRNRLEFLGELAASLAHELNQPLNVIHMACHNLKGHLAEDDAYAHAKLDKILGQIDRTSRIVESMGLFSKAGVPQSERFSLQSVLDQVEELVAGPLTALEINYRREVADELPFLEGDSVLLEQMLVNLLMNGRDSIQEKRGRTADSGTGDALTVMVPSWRGGDEVTIRVRDTGIGVAGRRFEELAQPFYTTKGEKGGTGLGLAVCQKIADNIGARITCRDRPEGGAEFELALPLPPQRADGAGTREEQPDGTAS